MVHLRYSGCPQKARDGHGIYIHYLECDHMVFHYGLLCPPYIAMVLTLVLFIKYVLSSAVGPVAQWYEHLISIRKVLGSNPQMVQEFLSLCWHYGLSQTNPPVSQQYLISTEQQYVRTLKDLFGLLKPKKPSDLQSVIVYQVPDICELINVLVAHPSQCNQNTTA